MNPNNATEPTEDLTALRAKLKPGMDLIIERRGVDMTLDDIAAVVGLSKFHAHRLFRKAYGVTPKDAMFEKQIELVKELLLAGTCVAETAKKAGFATQSHLTSRFRHSVGKPPAKWLASQRSNTVPTENTTPAAAQ